MGHGNSSVVEECEREKHFKQEQVCAFVAHCDPAPLFSTSQWPYDPPLSEAGTIQSRILASRIATLLKESSRKKVVVAEPSFCCVQTACEICRALDAPLLIDTNSDVQCSDGATRGFNFPGQDESGDAIMERPFSCLAAYVHSREVQLLACVGAATSKRLGSSKKSSKKSHGDSQEHNFRRFLHKYAKARHGVYRNVVVVTKKGTLDIACRALSSNAIQLKGTAVSFFLARRNVEMQEQLPSKTDDLESNAMHWSVEINCTTSNDSLADLNTPHRSKGSWHPCSCCRRRRSSDRSSDPTSCSLPSPGSAKSVGSINSRTNSAETITSAETILSGSSTRSGSTMPQNRMKDRWSSQNWLKNESFNQGKVAYEECKAHQKSEAPAKKVPVDEDLKIPHDLFFRMMRLAGEARNHRGMHFLCEGEAPDFKRCLRMNSTSSI